MITQSFLYNAIFFTYGLVLKFFFHVPSASVPYYYFAFAAGNLLGPLTIGRLFDTLGRKKMIAGTYIISGILLVITAILFKQGAFNATTQTIAWAVIFFFASAGASAGYLTASEVFPLEVRAKAIAVFFAIAQCFGFLGTQLYGQPDRHRQRPEQAVRRLPDRRGRDDHRWPGRDLPRRGRRR